MRINNLRQWLVGDPSEMFQHHTTSVVSLLVANLLPLFGVVFLGWSALVVVALYWLENVLIGIVSILKIITCSPDPRTLVEEQKSKDQAKRLRPDPMLLAAKRLEESDGAGRALHHASKLFLVPFFTVHYGLFCMVHGMFVFSLLGGKEFFGGPPELIGEVRALLSDPLVFISALILCGSHLISFFTNYLGRGEFRRTVAPVLMFLPYPRMVVLHVAILFGGWAVMALGSPVLLVALLVIGKTLLDLGLHLAERRRLTPTADRAALPPRSAEVDWTDKA